MFDPPMTRALGRLCRMLGTLLVGAVAMTACIVPDTDAGLPATAFVGMRVIDGTGAAPRDDMVVVVRGTRISALGHRSDIDVPNGASVIDATGQVLMPGLVDLHCHYGGGRDGLANAFDTQLRFGVTTVRSLGADGDANLAVIAEAESGAFPAPRIYTAGTGFSAPGGLPPGLPGIHRPTSETEAREMVRGHAELDVDLVKMWVDPTLDGSLAMGSLPRIAPEIRTAIVDEARKHGLPVVAHIYEEADARQLVAAGVRHFVHAVRAQDMDPSFVQLARDNDLTFAPALSKAQDAWFFAEYPEALDDPGLAIMPGADGVIARLRTVEMRDSMLGNDQLARLRGVYERTQRFIKTMQNAGITIGVGSDCGAGLVAFGWGTHHEMHLLVDAGLTPLEALTAGTGNGARILEGDTADFGTIAVGHVADLLLLDADPSIDIGNSRKIDRVMQRGQWVEDIAPAPGD